MDMKVLAIDPGTTDTAYVELWDGKIKSHAKIPNDQMLQKIVDGDFADNEYCAMEMIASYGMPVGKEVFETCVWIGRFLQAWGREWEFVYRREVKMHLCNSMKAKDANVRQALIDLFGAAETHKSFCRIVVDVNPTPLGLFFYPREDVIDLLVIGLPVLIDSRGTIYHPVELCECGVEYGFLVVLIDLTRHHCEHRGSAA